MKNALLTTLTTLCIIVNGFTQIHYSGKIETGYLKFVDNTITVDPGPDWRGYNLENENGFDLNLTNGIEIRNMFFIGIGIGYLNFEGNEGFSIFSDFDYCILKKKLSPLINTKIGYNRIWNQYENGTQSIHFETGVGLNYKFKGKFGISIQSGLLATQQSILIPIKFGFRF